MGSHYDEQREEAERRDRAKAHRFQSDPDRVHTCDECGRSKEEHPSTTVVRNDAALDALLDEAAAKQPKTGPTCTCCSTPVLRDLIARYLERKDAGDDMPSVNFLCSSIITPRFKIGRAGVEGHIRRCLKRKP